MVNRKDSRIIFPLVFLLAVSVLSFISTAAGADSNGAAGPIGLPDIVVATQYDNPTEVGLNGKLWQVIGYEGSGVARASGAMTLLLKNGESYGAAKFNANQDPYATHHYADISAGELYLKMQSIYAGSAAGEKALLQARDIEAKADDIDTETVPNQYFWPLSIEEADTISDWVLDYSDDWWLRSPGISYYQAACVSRTAELTLNSITYHSFGVRPACTLTLLSALFAPDASSAGAAALSSLAAFAPPPDPIKLTAVDSAFSSDFAITQAAVSGAPGDSVTLNYSGAAAGTNHFLRVKLISSAAPGEIAYVAVPASGLTASSGSFSLFLPTNMPVGAYTAYVWVEEGNAANAANRGSTPDTFTLTVDNAKPTVASVWPSGAGIATTTNALSITFTEAMNIALAPGSAPTGTVTLSPSAGSAPTLAFVNWTNNGTVANYTISGLAYGTTYTYGISGFQDAAGNTMDAVTSGYAFSTIAATNATITPTSSTFDRYAASAGYIDVSTTLTPGSYTLASITLSGGVLTPGVDYVANGGVYTFRKEYLATLGTGSQEFIFHMSGGTNPVFTVTVSDSTPPTPVSASISNALVRGTVGSALGSGQTATITLTGDTITAALLNVDASSWFASLPAGIVVTAAAQPGSTAITLFFSGTPTEPSNQPFSITLPSGVLAGGSPILVHSNPSARFSISAIRPPSPLPKTGDTFPLSFAVVAVGAISAAACWLGIRLIKRKPHTNTLPSVHKDGQVV